MTSESELTAAAERLLREGPVAVVHLAKRVPAARAGRVDGHRGTRGHVGAMTLVRWIRDGRKGVYLDGMIGAGGGWHSSLPALGRFFARLTAMEMEAYVRIISPTARERANAEANRELDEVLASMR